jgi:hypothetical protein
MKRVCFIDLRVTRFRRQEGQYEPVRLTGLLELESVRLLARS